MRLSSLRTTTTVIAILGISSFAWSNAANPPDGSGDYITCGITGCHERGRSQTGAISLTASASDYQPGDTIEISVSVSEPGKIRWGFELTASTYTPDNGTLLITDPARIQLSTVGNQEYAKHTALGTDSGTADVSPGWTLRWVAPDVETEFAAITAACVAADGDGTATGDHFYRRGLSLHGTYQCPITLMGDVNATGTVNAADLIYMVGWVFKGGVAFIPCTAVGDVNCSGAFTSADILYLVDYIFNGGPSPCDACTLIPGTWSCP